MIIMIFMIIIVIIIIIIIIIIIMIMIIIIIIIIIPTIVLNRTLQRSQILRTNGKKCMRIKFAGHSSPRERGAKNEKKKAKQVVNL